MTPLEAACDLAEDTDFAGTGVCCICIAAIGSGESHRDDCPLGRLPKIVAALEAAERLIASSPQEPSECEYDMGSGEHGPVMAFCGANTLGPHLSDCPYQALVAALKGEEVRV